MATKVYVLLAALVFAGAVAMPIAHTQVDAVNITGIVPCGLGGASGLLAPRFPDAHTLVMCVDIDMLNTTTNSNGEFSLFVSLPGEVASVVDGRCRAVVTTPLPSCNRNLPSTGYLTSPLAESPVGVTWGISYDGLLGNILNYVAKDFVYLA